MIFCCPHDYPGRGSVDFQGKKGWVVLDQLPTVDRLRLIMKLGSINYYRLRKGKYRAIFKIEHDDIFVLGIEKRAEVYKRWP